MTYGWAYIAVLLVALAALAVTGWWRLVLVPFRINPGRMTVRRLGLQVSAPEDVERVDGVLRSFAGGFNAMIARPSDKAWQAYCNSLPALFTPFGHEGAAMGYSLRRLFRAGPGDFEETIVRPGPHMRYLYYVGLGFWAGMRDYSASRLTRMVDRLDPMHGHLCYDGYGFKHAFFDYAAKPQVLGKLDLLDGYARHAAYQGVGRAFFFLYMSRVDLMIAHLNRLSNHAADAAAGLGLASVFVNPDRLDVAQNLGTALPADWRRHFHLGMCFALKARAIGDVDQFDRDLARLEPRARQACQASVRECDRVELQVRADHQEDGYRRWREQVTEWLDARIEYPMRAIKPTTSSEHTTTDADVNEEVGT